MNLTKPTPSPIGAAPKDSEKTRKRAWSVYGGNSLFSRKKQNAPRLLK